VEEVGVFVEGVGEDDGARVIEGFGVVFEVGDVVADGGVVLWTDVVGDGVWEVVGNCAAEEVDVVIHVWEEGALALVEVVGVASPVGVVVSVDGSNEP
jgi:hypothetical protein